MSRDTGSFDPGPSGPTKLKMSLDPAAKTRMVQRCQHAEIQFRTAPLATLQPLACNPMALHTLLYDDLCPSLPQAIGTCRGAPGTALEQARRVVLTRGMAPGLKKTDPCIEPALVAQSMVTLLADIQAFWDKQHSGDALLILSELTHRFFWIHPFLDGNGRVWRLALIALARSAGLAASTRWQVAARPYSASFSLALQKFSTQPRLLQSELAAYFTTVEPSALQ